MKLKKFAICFAVCAIGFNAAIAQPATSSFGTTIVNTNITAAEVERAEAAWGQALIAISTAYDNQGFDAAKQMANNVIDAAYGYNMGPVLFKPTMSHGTQTFRTTRAGAISYFVGGDPNFPTDHGFALKHWRAYAFQNAGVYINGDLALTMGKVILTDRDGKVTIVDKTWGFKKDGAGNLRIVLHHSSLPYTPPEAANNAHH